MVTAQRVRPKRKETPAASEIVYIKKADSVVPLEAASEIPLVVEWVVPVKGEGPQVANLWSQSYNAMLLQFQHRRALRASNITDINRSQLHTKLTTPLVTQMEDGANWIDGGKDLRMFTVQQILLAVAKAEPTAVSFFFRDLERRFLTWDFERGRPSKNKLIIFTNTSEVEPVPPPESIAELIQRFMQQEGINEEQFVDLFGSRHRDAARKILQGRVPTDDELFWLGAEISRPGLENPDDPTRFRYELRELQGFRGAPPEEKPPIEPVKPANGKKRK